MTGSHTTGYFFPDPEDSDENGLVAIGGDLEPERLIKAYSIGIFPWYEEHYPILWWSPDPRIVLFPKEIFISDSLRRLMRKQDYQVRIDTAFEQVIRNCASSGDRVRNGTWITNDMISAYVNLHHLGYAHSFEVWKNDNLIGGLYGVSLGRAFFGESMFFHESGASKIALVHLATFMLEKEFHFIDVQQETKHLVSMGAVKMPRKKFLDLLKIALRHETITGKWTTFGSQSDILKYFHR